MPQILDGAVLTGPLIVTGKAIQVTVDPDDNGSGTGGLVMQSAAGNFRQRMRSGGAGGSITQPKTMLSGEGVGAIIAQGWDGQAWRNGSQVVNVAEENWSPTTLGTSQRLQVVPLATSALQERLRVDPSVTAEDMGARIFDVTAGALKQIVRGAADSGGAGFRMLRVVN